MAGPEWLPGADETAVAATAALALADRLQRLLAPLSARRRLAAVEARVAALESAEARRAAETADPGGERLLRALERVCERLEAASRGGERTAPVPLPEGNRDAGPEGPTSEPPKDRSPAPGDAPDHPPSTSRSPLPRR